MIDQLRNAHDKRLFFILEHRFGLNGKKEQTLEQIGKQLGISRERVRQLVKETLSYLQEESNGVTAHLEEAHNNQTETMQCP